MANSIQGTQLYNKDGNAIYPEVNINDLNVKSEAIPGKDNVYYALIALNEGLSKANEDIGKLSGATDAVQAIKITYKYLLSDTTDKDSVSLKEDWVDTFQFPNTEKPYAWKKTIFEATGGVTYVSYEIVASDNTKEIQTIYRLADNTELVKIEYPKQKDEEGNDIEDTEDLTAFDDNLPDGWSETPQSISQTAPYLYMSVRKKGINETGKWGKFSLPALLGKWAFDSKLETLYKVVTEGTVTINRKEQTPSGWGLAPSEDFTGRLYMVTASSVNGQLQADMEGNVWSNPILLAIIN